MLTIIVKMKTKLIILGLFLSLFTLNSCQKEYMGPIDETGAPLVVNRGGEDGSGSSTDDGEGGITDGGHDSDYDRNSKGKRKPASPQQ